MTWNDKVYWFFKTIMKCSVLLAAALAPWFLFAVVVWIGVMTW